MDSSTTSEQRLIDGWVEHAKHLPLAREVLGIEPVPPALTAEALDEIMPPEGVSWQGFSPWERGYWLALRQTAETRSTRREPISPERSLQLGRAVGRAARNIELANSVLEPPELPSAAWADAEGPRARLQEYFRNVLRWFTVSPPGLSERTAAGRIPELPNAILLVAPTGVGKTMVGGNYLASCRIGEVRPDGQRRRALWLTISQQLMADCLNPDKTLQRCLPAGVTTTAIWEDHTEEEDASGDLVDVTVQSFERALAEGLINPNELDVVVVDEARHALSPRVVELLKRFDCPMVLLTATPTRSQLRSLLRDYHYVQPMNRREAIEGEVLSPVRMLTFAALSIEEAEHCAAQAAAKLFIVEGKKVVVYCQQGQDNAQARRVAELIDAYCREFMGDAYDQTLSYAEMVGSARADSPESIRAFEAQTHGGARTTCQMLGVGWDHPELDGAIWIGPQGDLVALEQESGRPLRPKADGREALLIEIAVPFDESKRHGPHYCLAQTVGLETIPGAEIVLGRARSWSDLAGEGRGRAPSGDGSSEGRFSDTLPPLLRSTLVPGGTAIAEIVIEPSRRQLYIPPAGFGVTDAEIAKEHDLPISYIRYHFSKVRDGQTEVPYKVVRRLPTGLQAIAADAPPVYQRYYHTETLKTYLAKYPLPAVSTEHILSVNRMAVMLGVSFTIINRAIEVLKLPDRKPTRAHHEAGAYGAKPSKKYSLHELTQVTAWIERVPVAEASDTPYAEVIHAHPWARSFLSDDDYSLKRNRPESDRDGWNYFVSAETVQRVESEAEQRKVELMPISELAEQAGVSVPVLMRGLTYGELDFGNRNRFPRVGGRQKERHLRREWRAEIVRRLKPTPLVAGEHTRRMILNTVNASESQLRGFFERHPFASHPKTLPGTTNPVRIYTDEALGLAMGQYGIRKVEQQLALPAGPVPSADRNEPEPEILGIDEACRKLQCTPAIFLLNPDANVRNQVQRDNDDHPTGVPQRVVEILSQRTFFAAGDERVSVTQLIGFARSLGKQLTADDLAKTRGIYRSNAGVLDIFFSLSDAKLIKKRLEGKITSVDW